ncbi:MAG: hypothetical protein LBT90_03020 [Holosporaceae bacterium]|nr:hypothetical protein [Holosporaceae bacterium]
MKKNMFGALASLCLCMVFGKTDGMNLSYDGLYGGNTMHELRITPPVEFELTPYKYSLPNQEEYKNEQSAIIQYITKKPDMQLLEMINILNAFCFYPSAICDCMAKHLKSRDDNIKHFHDLIGYLRKSKDLLVSQKIDKYQYYPFKEIILKMITFFVNSELIGKRDYDVGYRFSCMLSKEEIETLLDNENLLDRASSISFRRGLENISTSQTVTRLTSPDDL